MRCTSLLPTWNLDVCSSGSSSTAAVCRRRNNSRCIFRHHCVWSLTKTPELNFRSFRQLEPFDTFWAMEKLALLSLVTSVVGLPVRSISSQEHCQIALACVGCVGCDQDIGVPHCAPLSLLPPSHTCALDKTKKCIDFVDTKTVVNLNYVCTKCVACRLLMVLWLAQWWPDYLSRR